MEKNYQTVFKTFLVVVLLGTSGVLIGQNTNLDDNGKCYYQWYLNLNGGITQNHCDLQEGSWHLNMLNDQEMAFGFGGKLGKHISPVFTLYGSLIKAPLKGYRERRNLYFESDLTDYILGTTVNFSNLVFGYNANRRLTIYGTTGIGFVDFDAKAYISEDKNDMPSPDFTTVKPYKKDELWNQYLNTTETMIPTGIGADFKLSNRWDINFESTIRWFDSDKLDAVVRGGKNDAYYYTSLGLSYNFWRPKEKGVIKLNTEPNILALVGDSVPIEIKGTIPDYFNSKAIVDFTPVLKYGSTTKQLPTIYLQGENVPEELKKSGAITISATGGTFTYKTKVKYEPGMDVSELWVDPMCSIGTKPAYSLIDRKVADGLILTAKRVRNNEETGMAEHNYVSDIVKTAKGVIYFIVNRWDLRFDYELNKNETAKKNLADMISFMNQGWKIKNIDIHAWASPEGEETWNQGLSEKRSQAGKTYVEEKYNEFIKKLAKEQKVKPETLAQPLNFNLTPHGEDWDGFMSSLQASNIKDKNIIANVVNSQSDKAKREQEIRNMTVIYKEIEKDILPPLRRAEITVNCLEPSKTNDQLAQLATTDPGKLTANELLYAATLTEDLNAKLAIYKSVTELYPDDWRGFNNAGYICLKQGKNAEAKTYLTKAQQNAQNNGIVLNNLGVAYAKEKNFAQAKSNYLAAQKQGSDVNYNLGIIKILEGNYNGAITSFGSKKCDYNVALAQLLSGNYNGASTTLNCAEKDAQTYYLMAVVGARTNNDAMVFENLKKAGTADASLKDVAREDREFMKYFTNADFLNALR